MALQHVLIGGGTGFIGSKLIKLFKDSNVPHTVISRLPGPGRISWQELQQYGLPKNTSAVINVAGQNILDQTRRWTPEFKQDIRKSRIDTNIILAQAVTNINARAFVTISGVAYYPPNDIAYTEDAICEAYDFYSELCHDWESAAHLPSNCNTRQVIIRSGVVLGKGGGMIQSLYLPFWFGLGGCIGTGTQIMPWIHSLDLAHLFMFALKNDNVYGILNGVAPEIASNKDFTEAFACAMRRPILLYYPSTMIKILLTEERAKVLLEGQRVKPERLLNFGFKYYYPSIDRACKECVI